MQSDERIRGKGPLKKTWKRVIDRDMSLLWIEELWIGQSGGR